jgi:hypothetical protein
LYQLNNNGIWSLSASWEKQVSKTETISANESLQRFFANTPKFGVFSEKSKIVEN